jgi:hypothetical protein
VWARERTNCNPEDPIDAMTLQVCDHPFSKVPYASLTQFALLWDWALKQVLSGLWKEHREKGDLRVKGERNFEKRCGAIRTVAEDHFSRFLKPRLERQHGALTSQEFEAFFKDDTENK